MLEYSTCDLKIDFEFGTIDGRSMTVEVQFDKFLQRIAQTQDSIISCTVPITLPGTLQLKFYGKTNKDTQVDKSGNVIKDMFIRISKISIDCLDVRDHYLHQKLKLITDDGRTVVSSYIGFNGVLDIPFDAPDVFTQYLRMNS